VNEFKSETTTWTPVTDKEIFLREVERRAGATRDRMLRGTERVHANHLDNDADSQECADWLSRILGQSGEER